MPPCVCCRHASGGVHRASPLGKGLAWRLSWRAGLCLPTREGRGGDFGDPPTQDLDNFLVGKNEILK